MARKGRDRGGGGGRRRAREKSVSFSFFRLSLSSSPAPFFFFPLSPLFPFFSSSFLSLSFSLLPRRLYSQQLGISQATLDIVFAASRVSFSLEILSAPRRASPSLSSSSSTSSSFSASFFSLSISVASAAGIARRRSSPLLDLTPAEESRESVPRGFSPFFSPLFSSF